jgi:hypothetical protein
MGLLGGGGGGDEEARRERDSGILPSTSCFTLLILTEKWIIRQVSELNSTTW